MKQFLHLFIVLIFSSCYSQNRAVTTVYFEFDKHKLPEDQIQVIVDFMKTVDTTKIESIQIFGYCDDRGAKDYNYDLSKKRVMTVQDILTANGFNQNKIVIIEGKGRVIIQKDDIENLSEIRSKNRRVDLFLVKKNSYGKGIYNSFRDIQKVGDRIYLETILFPLGSSKLTAATKNELDKIVILLQKKKTLEFEIRGHVCCTPNYYEDAIDRDTKERKLSLNRAKSVYRYLLSKGVNSLRMHYVGCGNKYPLGQGDALDRRVEFLILKI